MNYNIFGGESSYGSPTRRIIPVFPLAIALFWIVWSSGCHVSRGTVYPDFIKQKDGLGEITILSDIMVIQAIRGDTTKIDVVENKDIAVSELQLCADHLRGKGYQVRNTVLTSIGLLMNPDKVYKLVRTPDDQLLRDDALATGYAPFYLDPLVGRDSIVQKSIAGIYSAIINIGQKQDTLRTFVTQARILGRYLGVKTVMVLLTGGFNVPITKGIAEETTNPDKGIKAMGVRPRTQISMLLYIINSVSGEIIWEDRVFKNEGIIHKDRVLDMLTELLQDLP